MDVAGEASTGREAIHLFQELQPDITLMDLRLPDMSGIGGSDCDSCSIPLRSSDCADYL